MRQRAASNAASVIWPRFDAESHASAGVYFASIALTYVTAAPTALYPVVLSLAASQPVSAAVNP